MSHTRRLPQNPAADELGQTITEYAFLVSLIAIVIAVGIPTVAAPIRAFFDSAAAAFGG